MITKISMLATFAALPLVLTGCGGDSADTTSSNNQIGQPVKFGANSQDLGSLPFFFQGTKVITGSDGTLAGVASPISTTTKSLAKVTLTLTGANIGAAFGHPSGYQLTISIQNTNTGVTTPGDIVPLTYKVGIAKDTFNDLYSFAPDAAGPVNKLAAGATAIPVLVNSTLATISGPVTDFTVNVPTAIGTTLAPFSGTTGTTSLAFGAKLVADAATSLTGGRDPVGGTAVVTDIVIPWSATTTQLGYWKGGFGLVESVARYNWVLTLPATVPAPGTLPAASGVSDFAVNPPLLPAINAATQANYGFITPGFVNPEVAPIPRASN